MKKILVVGGAGYIGSHFVKLLKANGYSCIVLDNFSTGHLENLKALDTPYIRGDLGDATLLESIFEKHSIECVIHFSAHLKVGESTLHPSMYYENNVIKTKILLDTMLKHNCTQFIFSSTAATYGNPTTPTIKEDHPTNPINPYGNTKLACEYLIKDYHHAYGLQYGIFRYFNVCGASSDQILGDRRYPAEHLIPIVLFALKENKTISIFGEDYPTKDGTCIRDFIHIEDLVYAHYLLLKYFTSSLESQLINLGTSKGYSVKEIIELSEKITNIQANTLVTKRREGDPPKLLASYEKAERILNWKPKKNLHDIISDSWNWICRD